MSRSPTCIGVRYSYDTCMTRVRQPHTGVPKICLFYFVSTLLGEKWYLNNHFLTTLVTTFSLILTLSFYFLSYFGFCATT